MRGAFLLIPLLSLLAVVTAPDRLQAQDAELQPPELRWTKGSGVLNVLLRPQEGSHLASAQAVEVTLDDEAYFLVRWREPAPPAEGPLRVRLPRIAARTATGWELRLSGAVCNDDGSVCLPFHGQSRIPRGGALSGRFNADIGGAPVRPQDGVKLPAAGSDGAGPEQPDDQGLPWYSSDKPGAIEAAFSQARSTGRNLLIDFYARWCPPCERLRTEFLEDPERATLLTRFVLLKVDGDAAAGFPLKDRYRVGGYPSLLVVGENGSLLDRIVGWSGDRDALAARLSLLPTAVPLEELPQDARAVERARRWMADGDAGRAWAVLTDSFASVPQALARDREGLLLALSIAGEAAPEAVPELALAASEGTLHPGRAAEFVARAIEGLESLGQEREAQALKKDSRLQLMTSLASRLPVSVVRGRGDMSFNGSVGLHKATRLDDSATAAYQLALWSESADQRQAWMTEAAFRLAAAIVLAERSHADSLPPGPEGRISIAVPGHLLDTGIRSRLPDQAGRIHDLLFLLNAAEMPLVTEAILRAMSEEQPEEFTWHHKLGRFLADQRRWDEAVPVLEQARRYSYGDNGLRAARSLAAALAELDEIDRALAILKEALADPPPKQERVRTHRYRRALESLQDELRQEKSN
ncbi:MAG: thioredoxin family protein [Myxococcota bacterium]|nr:thioredoxin family protein [Myxococcota bacterium]